MDHIPDKRFKPSVRVLLFWILAVVLAAFVVLSTLRPREGGSVKIEGDPLDIRSAGIRLAGSNDIFDMQGKKIGESENWCADLKVGGVSPHYDFFFELPQDGIMFPPFAMEIRDAESSRGYLSKSSETRTVLLDDKPRLCLGVDIPRKVRHRLLSFIPTERTVRRVDVVLRYYADPVQKTPWTFEGPFLEGDVQRSKGGKVELEVLSEMWGNAHFRIHGTIPIQLPDNPRMIIYDIDGRRYVPGGNTSGEWSPNSGTSFDDELNINGLSLKRVGRIVLAEEPRVKMFRNVIFPKPGDAGQTVPPWIKETASRLGREPDKSLAQENFQEKLDDALKVIDTVRGFAAFTAWDAVNRSRRSLGDYTEEVGARLRETALKWSTSEDPQMRINGVKMGLRFGLPGYMETALEILGKIENGKGPWGLSRLDDGRWSSLGSQASYSNGFFSETVRSIQNYTLPLTAQQMSLLKDTVLKVEDPRIRTNLIRSLTKDQYYQASRDILMELARQERAEIWWTSLEWLAPRLEQEGVDSLPREMKIRVMAIKNGPRPSDAKDLEAEALNVYTEILKQDAESPGLADTVPVQDILRWISSDYDRSTATEVMITYLDIAKGREPKGGIVESIVKRINLWNGTNIGRLGANIFNQGNPAQQLLDWSAIAADTVEWHKTGIDPGVLPEGYTPGNGDLRIVWRNMKDPEASWIDTWRMPDSEEKRVRKHLLWVQQENHSSRGDFTYYSIRTSRASIEDSDAKTQYEIFWNRGSSRTEEIGEQGRKTQFMMSRNIGATGSQTGGVQTIFEPEDLPLRLNPSSQQDWRWDWEIWIEAAQSIESVISTTKVFKEWQEDPRRGLRFPGKRFATVRFPEDRSVGTVMFGGGMSAEAQGKLELPVWVDADLQLMDPSLDLSLLEPFNEVKSLSISINSQDLSNTDLSPLERIGNLRNLDLGDAVVSDAGLEEIGRAISLRRLSLNVSRGFSSDGVASLANLPNLEMFSLGGGTITEKDIETVGKMKTLQSLFLEEHNMDGVTLMPLTNLKRVDTLSLQRTKLTGDSIVPLSQMPNLTFLGLGETGITDEGLMAFDGSGFTELEILRLDGCPVTDAGLEHLKKLKSLMQLNLNETQVTEAGVKALESALPECTIESPSPRP